MNGGTGDQPDQEVAFDVEPHRGRERVGQPDPGMDLGIELRVLAAASGSHDRSRIADEALDLGRVTPQSTSGSSPSITALSVP